MSPSVALAKPSPPLVTAIGVDAVSVVNAPDAGVVPPRAGGAEAFAVASVPSPDTWLDGTVIVVGSDVHTVGDAVTDVPLQYVPPATIGARFDAYTTALDNDVAAEPDAEVTAPVNAGNAAAGNAVALLKLMLEGVPVALVSTNVEGVPRFGVTSVGEVASTTAVPAVPVVLAATNCELLFEPSTVADAGMLGI
jgi:hypothetical protein